MAVKTALKFGLILFTPVIGLLLYDLRFARVTSTRAGPGELLKAADIENRILNPRRVRNF